MYFNNSGHFKIQIQIQILIHEYTSITAGHFKIQSMKIDPFILLCALICDMDSKTCKFEHEIFFFFLQTDQQGHGGEDPLV